MHNPVCSEQANIEIRAKIEAELSGRVTSSSDKEDDSEVGLIIGISLSAIAVTLLIGGVLVYLWKRKQKAKLTPATVNPSSKTNIEPFKDFSKEPNHGFDH